MDGSRGAITTMRSLGCGGPPTTDTEPLRGGGAVARDRAGALVPHPHRYFQVAGRPTLFESLWRGGRVEGDRAWPLDRHSHSDLQVAGGPPPHLERFERGGGLAGGLGSPPGSCAAHSGRPVVSHHPQCLSVGVRRSIRDHAVPRWLPPSVFGAEGGPPLRTVPFERGGLGPSLLGPRCRTVNAPDPSTSCPSL